MATVFDTVTIRGMRPTHFAQLLTYLDHQEQEGWHSGNKKLFEQRHKELRKWLEGIYDYANSKGIIIPK